jgi:prolycopene isomerase
MISDTYNFDKDYQWCENGEADKAGFSISLNSNIEKATGNNNKFVMRISQLQGYEPWKKYESAYLSNDKAEYNGGKKRIAEILIKRAEKVIPNISKHIEVIEIATPLTLRRYTGNPNGACYGWANTVKQSNPLQRSPQKTPIKNLYLSSAWTFPGEGQMGVILCGWRLGRRLAG